jgi:hypothetical protein
VIESAAVATHQFIQFSFAGVTKWRMTNVVYQAERFHQLGIQAKRRSHSAADLRDFERMRQAIPKVIGKARAENLSFCFQSAERPRVDDSVAVARVFRTVRMMRFRHTPPARTPGGHSVASGKR